MLLHGESTAGVSEVQILSVLLMTALTEAVAELRAEYCEGCQNQYSREEILEGAQCEFCDHVDGVGRSVAGLRD